MPTRNCYSCDDIFDILTRAPFVTQSLSDTGADCLSNGGVGENEHLHALANAKLPAPNPVDPGDFLNGSAQPTVDHTVRSDDVLRHLQACHECRQFADALRPATQCVHESLSAAERAGLPEFRSVVPDVMDNIQRIASPRTASSRSARIWNSAMTVLIAGLLMATGLAALFGDFHQNRSMMPTAYASVSPVNFLTSMNLSVRCGAASLNHAKSLVDKLEDACCSDCHISGQAPRDAQPMRGKIVATCSQCHHVTPTARNPHPIQPNKTCAACHVVQPDTTLVRAFPELPLGCRLF